jgi:hypothetical protein
MRQAIIELLPTNYIGTPMAAIASSNKRLKLFHNADRFIGMECVDPPIESPRSRAASACRPIASKTDIVLEPLSAPLFRRASRRCSEIAVD